MPETRGVCQDPTLGLRSGGTRLPAVIIARGGSTRLPRKNTKVFCGRPLVAWSIIQCHMSEYVTDTVLATDDEEIEEIGKEYGAYIVKRPVMRNEVTANVTYTMVTQELVRRGWDMKAFVHILPTSVLRKPKDIDDMVYVYALGDGTSAAAMVNVKDCCRYERTDTMGVIQFAMFDNTGKWYESALGMSCHDVHRYIDFHVRGNRFRFYSDRGEDPFEYSRNFAYWYRYIVVEPWQVHDIDYEHEFELCEWYFKKKGLDKIYNDWWKANAGRIRG